MVVDLNQLKKGQPGEAPTACMGWLPRPEYFRPPQNPTMIVPVLTIEFVDTLDRKQRVSMPPDMIIPLVAALTGWAASMMGGSAPQTPVGDDGQEATDD